MSTGHHGRWVLCFVPDDTYKTGRFDEVTTYGAIALKGKPKARPHTVNEDKSGRGKALGTDDHDDEDSAQKASPAARHSAEGFSQDSKDKASPAARGPGEGVSKDFICKDGRSAGSSAKGEKSTLPHGSVGKMMAERSRSPAKRSGGEPAREAPVSPPPPPTSPPPTASLYESTQSGTPPTSTSRFPIVITKAKGIVVLPPKRA